MLKSDSGGYEWSKSNQKDWADTFEIDLNFTEEFKRLFRNADIP